MQSSIPEEIIDKFRLNLTKKTGVLDLSGGRLAPQEKLTSIPEDVFKLDHLRILNLAQNRLSQIPGEIAQKPYAFASGEIKIL
jgi:hypothetical protein